MWAILSIDQNHSRKPGSHVQPDERTVEGEVSTGASSLASQNPNSSTPPYHSGSYPGPIRIGPGKPTCPHDPPGPGEGATPLGDGRQEGRQQGLWSPHTARRRADFWRRFSCRKLLNQRGRILKGEARARSSGKEQDKLCEAGGRELLSELNTEEAATLTPGP
ncbi:hypothetical protein CB1_000707029 [Camelus ferus]|nr:hypothetical protein CB1_000707029 [Camelus ferus]